MEVHLMRLGNEVLVAPQGGGGLALGREVVPRSPGRVADPREEGGVPQIVTEEKEQ